jgi:hypothetical protein
MHVHRYELSGNDDATRARADVSLEHDHGFTLEAESHHDHAVTFAVEVDGQVLALRHMREDD